MIISKTPLRISFFGGGTDYPPYFKLHGGAVLSTTINKHIFITVNPISPINDCNYKLTYSKLEKCNTINEIAHPSVRECLRFVNTQEKLEIHVVSELPAKTGLGSSSSFTVGFLNALNAQLGNKISKAQLAANAIHVEQQLIGEDVGSQDQAAAAYGGLNRFDFRPDGTIVASPVAISATRKAQLNQNLMLFYTGITRYADEVIKEQIKKTNEGSIIKDLSQMQQMVDTGIAILSSEQPLANFGKLLHEAWQAKRGLSSSITSSHLDSMYSKAIQAGALGGKLLGAGGGGFFLFYVEPDMQASVRQALQGHLEVPFQFEEEGSQIIFIH